MSIGRNTAIGLATDATVFGLGIVVSIVLTRSLGPQQRGVYSLLVATNVLLAATAQLSVTGACSTFLSTGRYRLGQMNGVALLLAVVMGVLAFALTCVAFVFLQSSVFAGVAFGYLVASLVLLPISIYQLYWNYMMIGLNRILTLNKLNLAVNTGSAILMIIVVGVLGLGIVGFLTVWLFSNIAGGLAAFIIALRTEKLEWPPRNQTLRDTVGFGLRGHGANIAHQLFLRFDVYTVNAIVGTTGLGFYSLATSLAEKLWLPVNALQASSVSKIAQLERQESSLLTARVTRTAVLLMVALATPLGLVSPWLIPFLYGSDFSASVLPLILLLGGVLAFVVMMILNNYILGQMQRPGLLSIISWLQLGLSIPLYIVFIIWLGIIGAAIASSVTYLIAMVCTLYVFIRDSGLPVGFVLVPRADDFKHYARLVRAGIGKVPQLNKLVRPRSS